MNCVACSGIEGYKVDVLRPSDTATASHFNKTDDVQHIVFTAETHNFPTGRVHDISTSEHNRIVYSVIPVCI